MYDRAKSIVGILAQEGAWMPEPTYLELYAEDGNPLRHKYFQQEGNPVGLLIIFPGDNYGVDGPLLYYPGDLLWDLGWDTVAITYGYQSAAKPFSPLAIADVLSECRRAVETILQARDYSRIVLIGKSLGASLIALLCQQMELPEYVQAIYLTPPLGPMFNPILLETTQDAMLAIGTEDRFYDANALKELEMGKSLQLVVIEGADHSMNVSGQLDSSVEAVRKVSQAVIDFITKPGDR